MAANSFFDDHVGILKDFVDAVRGEMIFVDDIAAGIFIDCSRAGFHRRFRVYDNRQQFVIHLHRFRGVFRQVAIVRHHHRQRLTEIAHLVDRQRIKLHRPQHRAAADAQRLDMLRDVFAGKDGVNAGMERAASTSTDLIFACAQELRTNDTCSVPDGRNHRRSAPCR